MGLGILTSEAHCDSLIPCSTRIMIPRTDFDASKGAQRSLDISNHLEISENLR